MEDLRDKIVVSFSGGRSSAVMTKILLDKKRHSHNVVVVFANTGCEHEDTLRFINDCDLNWDFNTVWIEAAVSQEKNVGIAHKIVDFATASRDGQPFEDAIKKYGMFNIRRPQCSSYLKRDVIRAYLKTIGFIRGKKINHETAIGIRADEIDRMSINQAKEKYLYPLIEDNWRKDRILKYMSQFSWDLNVPEFQGNCTWCWKKTVRTLAMVAQKHPEVFDFPKRMEEKYGHAEKTASYAKRPDGLVTFFRDDTSVGDILALAKNKNFSSKVEFNVYLDKAGSCAESCEGFDTDGS